MTCASARAARTGKLVVVSHGVAGKPMRSAVSGPVAGRVAQMMYALATPSRGHILGCLRDGPGAVGEIVDPVLRALEHRPPRVLALTHIHLDHAGASGSLLRRFPDAEVWVHERGAPHLIDPAKLLESASRLYGERMGELWGELLPVPRERIKVLVGGESLGPFRVAHTPGHASHHVSYLHEPTGRA